MLTKFNDDFNTNLYDGIEVDEDTKKLKTYVSYFAEFREVIKREENVINHELVSM